MLIWGNWHWLVSKQRKWPTPRGHCLSTHIQCQTLSKTPPHGQNICSIGFLSTTMSPPGWRWGLRLTSAQLTLVKGSVASGKTPVVKWWRMHTQSYIFTLQWAISGSKHTEDNSMLLYSNKYGKFSDNFLKRWLEIFSKCGSLKQGAGGLAGTLCDIVVTFGLF